jgi:hypothetical protein
MAAEAMISYAKTRLHWLQSGRENNQQHYVFSFRLKSMKRIFASKCAVAFVLIFSFGLAGPQLHAQVPDEFTNLYSLMQTDLTNFAAMVDAGWNGEASPAQFTAVLLPATDGGQGNASTNLDYLNSAVIPFLKGLTDLGVKTVKFSISFPTLYQPYYNSTSGANNPAGYTNMLNFYTDLVARCRADGLKS